MLLKKIYYDPIYLLKNNNILDLDGDNYLRCTNSSDTRFSHLPPKTNKEYCENNTFIAINPPGGECNNENC